MSNNMDRNCSISSFSARPTCLPNKRINCNTKSNLLQQHKKEKEIGHRFIFAKRLFFLYKIATTSAPNIDFCSCFTILCINFWVIVKH